MHVCDECSFRTPAPYQSVRERSRVAMLDIARSWSADRSLLTVHVSVTIDRACIDRLLSCWLCYGLRVAVDVAGAVRRPPLRGLMATFNISDRFC